MINVEPYTYTYQYLSRVRDTRIMNEEEREINEMMARVAPELESSFATYPLKRTHWLDTSAPVSDEDERKIVAFIAHPRDPNFPRPVLKADYVWGQGKRGFGYYHLLTRDAYIALNQRVRNKGPPMNCCCFRSSNTAFSAEDYDVAKDIIYNRSTAPVPDDVVAFKSAIDIARGTAQVAYNMSQDVQFVMMALN